MVNRFKNLSIRWKLISGFAVAGAVSLVIGGMSFFGMNQLTAKSEFIYKTNLLPTLTLAELRATVLRRSNSVLWHLLSTDSASMKAQEQGIAEYDKKIDELLVKYEPAIVEEHERTLFEQVKAGLPAMLEVRTRVLSLSRDYRKDAAAELQRGELAEKFKVVIEGLDGLLAENKTTGGGELCLRSSAEQRPESDDDRLECRRDGAWPADGLGHLQIDCG